MLTIFPRTTDKLAIEGGWTIEMDFIHRVQKILWEEYGYGNATHDAEEVEATLLAAEKVLGRIAKEAI